MKKPFLTILAAAAIATAAQAQPPHPNDITIIAAHGHTLTIGGAPDERASTPVTTYIWYRNGIVIQNATEATYTVPVSLANGLNQRFWRRAQLDGECTGVFGDLSNIVTVHFKCGGGHGTVVTNTSTGTELCWADYNTGAGNTFVGTLSTSTTLGRGDVYSPFFQWSRMAAWPATGVATPAGWTPLSDGAMENAATWSNDGHGPCPAGWRLPTRTEFQSPVQTSGGGANAVGWTAGGTWRAANAVGNTVAGIMYGHRHSACGFNTGQDMFGCIFLPAVGLRGTLGTLSHQAIVGYYWASEQNSATVGQTLRFCRPGADTESCASLFNTGSSLLGSFPASNHLKLEGLSVRCVQ